MKNKFKINAFQWLKTVQTIALMLMASLSVAAAGQETLSLKLKNIPLREAFTQIEEQGGYVFLVAGDAKPALDRKVDVTVESGLITDILEAVLADTGLDYKVVGKQISIFLKEETVSVELATPAIELQQPAKKTVTGTVVDAT
ncbi:MAG: STN domain-containing protein, partial [Tannerella sp.]|nr:STN domain-containing protein [Tannerella sp.]